MQETKSLTDTVLMIRPARFGFNPETAENNAFQHSEGELSPTEINARATAEFDVMIAALHEAGVKTLVVQDSAEPHTPDSIFPNNWVSFHGEEGMALYPMFAPNRRMERAKHAELVRTLASMYARPLLDFSGWENDGRFLEGTGSLVLDRAARIAYANYSVRTDKRALDAWSRRMGYETVAFRAVDKDGKDVYHTNVVMALGANTAVVCLEALPDPQDVARVESALNKSGKIIIPISLAQMYAFAGNMLQILNDSGEKLFILSETARRALNEAQIAALSKDARLLPLQIDVIEKYGGGSVRCMMCEVFA